MSRSMNLILALSAGLSGGFLSRYIEPLPAFAQAPGPAPKEIRAQTFVIVDDKGNLAGVFKSSSPKQGEAPTAVLLDPDGMEVWRGRGATIRPASQR